MMRVALAPVHVVQTLDCSFFFHDEISLLARDTEQYETQHASQLV